MPQRVDVFAVREERTRPSLRPEKSIPPWRESAAPLKRRSYELATWVERPEPNADPPGDQFPL